METLSRPLPPRSRGERARAWIEWFGIGRLIGASAATLVVCAGAFWLVRSPAPPTEATLPRATAAAVAAADASTGTGESPAGAGASSGTATPNADATSAAGAEAAAGPAVVVVHVAGAVVEPGVYELPAGARVRDAVSAAGGPVAQADWDALNLAALVTDASRVYLPLVGEELPTPPAGGAVADGPPVLVDVNVADVTALDALPGIGPATAAAIVTDRSRNGPFLGVDDLERVPGIGPAKVAALRDLVTT